MAGNDALAFAEKFLALLDSGRFTATYKFAVLTALIDVVVEGVQADGRAPERISARRVGQRVLELYWRQARPYPGAQTTDPGAPTYLRQSTQAGDLVSRITEFRQRHGVVSAPIEEARRALPAELSALEEAVVVTVIRMPLPKLQRFRMGSSSREDRFLYDFSWPDEVAEGRVRAPGFDDTLDLQPGVGAWLARLEPLLRPAIQQRWASFVADRSAEILEASWLDQFLFGATRTSLEPIRAPLIDLQHGQCFYCDGPVSRALSEVDHFIPWARHPDNGLFNLVVADPRCNNSKRDSLAAMQHLQRWLTRFNSTERYALTQVAEAREWPVAPDRTMGAARAAYLWLPMGTALWLGRDAYEPSDSDAIRHLLAAVA